MYGNPKYKHIHVPQIINVNVRQYLIGFYHRMQFSTNQKGVKIDEKTGGLDQTERYGSQLKYFNATSNTKLFSITQKINHEDGEEEKRNRELWAGSSKQGITEIESGPDIRKYNVSLFYVDATTTETRSVYLGTYDTKLAAENAMSFFTHNLSTVDDISFQRLENHWREQKACFRTLKQLRLSLRLCNKCDKLYCKLRCARCATVRYCSRACQKLDWSTHKIQCNKIYKAQKKKKKIQKENEKTVKKGMKDAARIKTRKTTDVTTDGKGKAKEQLDLIMKETAYADVTNLIAYEAMFKELGSRIQAMKYFIPDVAWDAGVEEGLLLKLKELMKREVKICSKFQTYIPVSFTQCILSNLLVGFMVPGSTMTTNSNAYRCTQLFGETEGALEALFSVIEARLNLVLKVPRTWLPKYLEETKEICRHTNTMLISKKICLKVFKKYKMKKKAGVRFGKWMHLTNKIDDMKYIDPDGGLAGLINGMVARIHIYCNMLKKNANFHKHLKLSKVHKNGTISQEELYLALHYGPGKIIIERGKPMSGAEINIEVPKNLEKIAMGKFKM